VVSWLYAVAQRRNRRERRGGAIIQAGGKAQPVIAAHCLVDLPPAAAQQKLQRWQTESLRRAAGGRDQVGNKKFQVHLA